MLFAVHFFDKQDQYELRKQYLPAHIEWLEQHRDVVLVGGSLREDPAGQPVGGLWIVEAESKTAIEELLKTDPFWIRGLRQGYEILYWSKAFAEKQVPI